MVAALRTLHNECVIWPYAVDGRGYPARKNWEKVHQTVCGEVNGAAPSPEHEVAHSCGNKRCLNPQHLRWATRSENMMDKLEHGTDNRGEKHPNAVLTAESVRKIRAAHGVPGVVLAAHFRVSQQTICGIRNRRSWKWLEG